MPYLLTRQYGNDFETYGIPEVLYTTESQFVAEKWKENTDQDYIYWYNYVPEMKYEAVSSSCNAGCE